MGFTAVAAIGLLAVAFTPESESYEQRFVQEYPPRPVVRDLRKFASIELYDARFLDWQPQALDNSDGGLAWGLSYRMSSLNEMFKVTGDEKYLHRNLLLAEHLVSSTDLATGKGPLPTWSSTKYSGGRRMTHLVHTAMIAFPVLEALSLTGKQKHEELLGAIIAALRTHDFQWRDGPRADEGYFVYPPDQERAGEVLPVNRLNAMAKCLWMEWKLTGNQESKRKALSLARFFKNRLMLSEGGAYLWPYFLTLKVEKAEEFLPEDMSHAALTASLVPLLAEDGKVFDEADLQRFAATLHQGILGERPGIVFADLQGRATGDPKQVDLAARWLEFAPYHRSIYPKLAKYYELYDRDPNPHRQSLVTALLIRYRP